MMNNNINEEVIRVLDFPENVRAKWGMYIDSANVYINTQEQVDS